MLIKGIVGPPDSGKSHLLLQALSYASANSEHSQGWIMLPVPSAIAHVTSTSPYAWNADRKLWTQPELVASFLDHAIEWNPDRLPSDALEAARRRDLSAFLDCLSQQTQYVISILSDKSPSHPEKGDQSYWRSTACRHTTSSPPTAHLTSA